MGDGGLLFLYAFKLCHRSVGAKPVSGKTDPVYGINKRTLSFVERKNSYTVHLGVRKFKARCANKIKPILGVPKETLRAGTTSGPGLKKSSYTVHLSPESKKKSYTWAWPGVRNSQVYQELRYT